MTTRCEICEAPDIAFFTKTYDRHYGYFDRYYDVYRCSNCGVLFINPMISDSELSEMYDEDGYYSYGAFDTVSSVSERYRKLRTMARQILWKRTKFEPGVKSTRINRCLDIGCGSGNWLFEMKEKGWHVSGVEISKNAATFGNSMGLNIFEGSLKEAGFPSDHFDYIRSNHSFEHLTNPVETMSEMRRITKQEGIIHIGVPNTGSVPFRLFRKYWFYLGIPFHPFNYNTKNLSLLLEKNGFRVIEVNYRHIEA